MTATRFLAAWGSLALLLLAGCRTSSLLNAEGRGAAGAVGEQGAPPPPALPGVAGQPLELSIEQAALLALHHNRDLRVRRLTPVIAGAFRLTERGAFDPELFAELGYARERATETARSTGGLFSVQGDDAEGSVGARQRYPSGTEVEVGVSQERSVSSRTPEQQRARVGLTVTQALLRGRGAAVNLAAVGQADLAYHASRYELRAFVETLLADTMIAYWRHVLAQEEIAIFESSLALSRKQLGDIESSIQVGALPATEAAAARAEVARREQALIDARSTRKERTLRLLRLVSPPPQGRLDRDVLATSAPVVDAEPVGDEEERVLLALRARPDLGEARLRSRRARLETVITRDGLLPRLDFFVSLGRTGYSDALFDSVGSLGENTYDLSAGIRFSQTLGNRAARGRHLAAQATRRQAAEAVANLEQLVRLDVRLALNEVERARQQIAATATTRTLEESTVEAERERFKAGESTALTVAQAQRDLLAARIDEVGAIVGYRIALLRLYLAEGSLLERSGILVP